MFIAVFFINKEKKSKSLPLVAQLVKNPPAMQKSWV